ncbi:bifunctional adenosylcobinamide kinase/adenosylcobinamide-phosphate guanylyltransferase, partial [Aerococcus urinae]|uniref:bifunctional adenosylcobinamide kinase/adenosylcobinamide-phosphate guanylyltransferase n=3 Tax=Aerococcaceae TaxID=186827 RepID=UPI002551A27F
QKIASLKAEEISAISDYFQQEVADLLRAAQKTSASLWLVTNETGWGVTPASQLGRLFVDFYGQVNQQLAAASDEVYLAIMGLKKQVKP